MIVLNQQETMKKAEKAFEDFCRVIKMTTGSEFAKADLPIFRNVFVNGYMKGLDDLVQMGKNQNKN